MGKNLWDNFKTLSSGNVEQKNGTYIATTYTMQVDITSDSTGVRPLLLKANNAYTFSLKTTISISSNKYVCLRYTNGESKNIKFVDSNFINFVPERDVEKIGFILYKSVAGDKVYDVQLEMGSEATSYEPYTEQSTTLPYTLYAIPVSTGGNIMIGGQQYVADYVDVERGKLVRMCKEVEYNGDESWSLQSINENNIANFVYNNVLALGYIGISDKLLLQNTDIANTKSEGFLINNVSRIYIRINKNRNISTVTEFKNFLSKNPIRILFALVTPQEIDLTPDQIQAYKSLSTNYPVTNIEVSSEQLNGYTIFNYPISMAEGWNYVKQQIGDTRDYIYDMDLQSAEAYVNSEYAVALAELEVM